MKKEWKKSEVFEELPKRHWIKKFLCLVRTNTQTGPTEWWGEIKTLRERSLTHDLSRQQDGLTSTLCLHTCLSTCQLRPTDDVLEGSGAVHSNAEALWVGLGRCGQGPDWVSQHCRANTCLDFTTKPLRPLSGWAQRLLCRFHFGSLGSQWEYECSSDARVPWNEK